MSRRETQRILIAIARLEVTVTDLKTQVNTSVSTATPTSVVPLGGGIVGLAGGIYTVWAQLTGKQ